MMLPTIRTTPMKALFAVTAFTAVITLAPVAAPAQDRAVDSAMGATSGLVVGAPVGAVGGGVIGYPEDPNIAHAMGLRRRPVYDDNSYDNYDHRHYTNRSTIASSTE
jgi:outer membrane lipoprotein SlyB